MPYPDRFYPVVDSVAWVARLAALGVGTVQLRAKNLNDSEALQMLNEVDREDLEFRRLIGKQQDLYQSARRAWQLGEVTSALNKIERVLSQVSGNKAAAAKQLGISRRSLYRWLERLNIPA